MTLNPTNMTTGNADTTPIASDPTVMGNAINTTDNSFIDPQILSAMVSAKLPNNLIFAPMAVVNTDLQGRPGDTLTVPYWKYTGEAKDLKEGAAIPLQKLAQTSQQIKIKQAGTGFEITDLMMQVAYGDPRGEAANQLTLSMSDHMDNDCLTTLLNAKLNVTANLDLSLINAIEATFINNTTVGIDNSEPTAMLNGVIIMNPLDVNTLIAKATETYTRPTTLGDNVLVHGAGSLGEILGWQLVSSRKMKQGQAIAMKPGALGIYMKRGVSVETQRDIIHKCTIVTADEYYATAINDDAKVALIKFGAPSATTATTPAK